MIKMLELSDNNYKAAIINVLKEVRVNTLEANVKKVKQKKLKDVKYQMEILELKI